MLRVIFLILSACLMSGAAAAQDLVPDRRLIVSRNVDFYGSDLQPMFDTTLQACRTVCIADDRCTAFTFNTKSNACFPKTAVSDRVPYEGAISATVIEVATALQQQAQTRWQGLTDIPARYAQTARNEADQIGLRHSAGDWAVDRLLDGARDQENAGNVVNAMNWIGAAVAQTDAADQWVEYARLALASAASAARSDDRNRYRERAVGAAINGYLRAAVPAGQVQALALLAEALEADENGRAMVPVLRLAQSLGGRADVDQMLDRAIAKYGFRITEHEVESNTADPRICAVFSEDLITSGQDYTPFVRVPDATIAVEAEQRRICLTGLRHGDRYTVTFRRGLPSKAGEALIKDVPLTVYVPDRAPSVAFSGRAYVLPKTSDAGIPIETVNLTRVNLTLRRVSDRNLLRAVQDDYFGRPLSYWQEQYFSEEIAEDVWSGIGEVQNQLNQTMVTRLPMGQAIRDLPAGVYALTALADGQDPYDDPGATQWFVLSDIGLTTMAGNDGLHVFARHLTDATEFEGLTVSLLSKANRVLGTAQTDARGYAVFDPGLMRGTAGAAPAMVMAEAGQDDFAFLSLTDPAFDLSDRGVEGRAPAGPVDVFVSTDRGAYRAGERVRATALVRDPRVAAVNDLPLTAILTRPDGVEYSRHISQTPVAGGHVFDMPIAPTAARGKWTLALFADLDAAALATQSFLVEDFIPERIDFDLALPDGLINPLSTPDLTIDVRYLFGAPGAALPVEGEVRLVSLTALPDLPGYRFGQHDAAQSARVKSLTGPIETDSEGKASVALILPEADGPAQPHQAEVFVRVSEGSARPVERRIERLVAPSGPVIGIKPLADGVVPEGTTAQFEVMGFGPSLDPQPMQAVWTLNRVRTQYQWYQEYGNWRWEPITTRTRVAGGDVTLGAQPVTVSGQVEWGSYELLVESADGPYAVSSVGFYAGWYAPADTSATPDTLELSLDKPKYQSGDTATLRLVPRYAGKALVSVLSDRLISMTAVDVTEGENLIVLPVTDDWGGGAYVTATVIRPMDVAAGQNPSRALGLAHAAIDPGSRRLNVSFDAPTQSAPRGPLEASVVVDGIAPGEAAYVTVAAVDLGILNLTGFQSPDPSGHYFGQRRLGMDIRDVYGRLIDGMNGAMGTIRSGGDASAEVRLESPPPTEELVAYFSGPVAVGPDGRATVRYDLPEFNGTVRLMAIAWTPTAVGQAEADVLVRDPIVVTASLPRFLSPGDQSRLLLDLVHTDGPAGAVGLTVRADGLTLDAAAVPASFDIGADQTLRFAMPITAGAEGDHSITVVLTAPGGQTLTKTVALGVRQLDPPVSQTRRVALAPGASFTLDDNVFAGLRRGSAEAVISAGPLARFDAPGLLASLDRYPYGCTEQVTSQAMPLLYLSSVAEAMGMGDQSQMDLRISQAVTKVLTRQAPNGAFGLWQAQSGDFWLDTYVTDFLSRARAAGHDVPKLAFDRALDNLRNRVAYAPDFDNGGEDIAYALMVLAREGQANMGDLRYYADTRSEALATPMAQAQLGAALALYGDQTRADRLFSQAARRVARQAPQASEYRIDYGSPLRDAAGVLSLAVEAGSNAVDRQALQARLTAQAAGMSTQDQSWALLAAHAMVQDPAVSGLLIDGAPAKGPFVRRLEGALVDPLVLTNSAQAPTDVTLTTIGVPEGATDRGGYGYVLERDLYDMTGLPIEGPITVGDRMVAVITVTPAEATGARLMVDVPLPAGLEIDNPNLIRSGDLRDMDWLETAQPEHSEFRAERFLAAVDWSGTDPMRLAFVVRAVSPGIFHVPAAVVEDMYRPAYRAWTASGDVVIGE
ncbi:alpha-2-macroglobulin family protein [Pseudoprimorskyibacter insulae]|uniref:Putative lipoprotein YfhM n=1 Tax=Pseudoprimorskyibacter insulae TaxID=1695997 RepID=A0A2R8AUK0_9RHOB|nr:alpha-2-macroglobulin family protein [Pseudoprimorskyibacter insulae]SPF79660.1 putative lipoprotein YfhM [Pseudoprimorskyibacter insulae]